MSNPRTDEPSSTWHGFWQVLADDPTESTHSWRDTTTTERNGHGFVLYTERHYAEIHTTAMRPPPAHHPPTDAELSEMAESTAFGIGTYEPEPTSSGVVIRHQPLVSIGSDHSLSAVRTMVLTTPHDAVVDTAGVTRRWRQLSGSGHSPLAGTWTSGVESDRWWYLVTGGHYAVMHADLTAPISATNASINVGARLETTTSFDHWPMLGQVFGYDVRKHESFRIERLERDRFDASIPTFDFPPAEWVRQD